MSGRGNIIASFVVYRITNQKSFKCIHSQAAASKVYIGTSMILKTTVSRTISVPSQQVQIVRLPEELGPPTPKISQPTYIITLNL